MVFLEATTVVVWLFGIVLVAWQKPAIHTLSASSPHVIADPYSWIFAFATALTVIIICYQRKWFGNLIAITLGALLISGLLLFVGNLFALIIAIGFVWFERTHRTYLSNNALLLTAILFGTLPIVARLDINTVILALAALSLYDVLGVFASRLIPTLALGAVTSYIPLLLLEPKPNVSWKSAPTLTNTSAIIGSGDIFLPAIMIGVVTFTSGIPSGLITLFGATIGWVLNTLLATIIKTGIPALPLLSAGMIIAYQLFS